MQFRVLGGLAVNDDRGMTLALGGPKQRAVLAALLVELDRPLPPDRLIERVWSGDEPSRAETSLQAYIANLRRLLEPDRRPREPARILTTEAVGYRLRADRSQVDTCQLEDLAREGHRDLQAGHLERAVEVLESALGLWAGPPLPELAGLDWVDAEAARLDRIRAAALDDRLTAGLAMGQHASLLARIEAAVTADPYHEGLRGLLALALYRCGRQREALAALHDARTVLIDEVGVEPGPELRRLEADILAQAPSLDVTPTARPPVPAPARTASSASAASSSAPPAARTSARPDWARPFVGREHELQQLASAMGGGAAVVVSGPAGIGKTRLVEEAAARAPERIVAWGRCPESAAQLPYWPWAQLVRQLEGAGALDRSPLPEASAGGEEAQTDRTTLHLAVLDALQAVEQPVVLVIDDLQWADPASLRLVEFLAGELPRTHVTLAVTVRPVEPGAGPALIDCLAELARQASVRVDLAGLTERDIAAWIEHQPSSAGRAPDPAVAALVHDRTAGNAFFVGEVVELLAHDGRLHDAAAAQRGPAVTGAVQDVVRRRVGRLPADGQQVLAAASVLGRSFDLDVLGAMLDRSALDLLDALDPAMAAGIVELSNLPGRLQFSHALVAESLVAESTPARRARWHHAAATALARLREGDLTAHLAEVAHHATEGAAAGGAEAAYRWRVAAAEDAAARSAHDDAAQHWARAAEMVAMAWPSDRRRRAETLVRQGRAHLAVDDVGAGFAVLVEAIHLAIDLGDLPLLAEAATPMHIVGLWQVAEVGVDGVDVVGALERAVEAYPPEPSAELALMLGALVDAAYWTWGSERLERTSHRAVSLARAVGDPSLLARTLQKRIQALWRSASLAERVASAHELLELADDGLPPDAEALARMCGAGVLWDLGETARTRHEVEHALGLATALGAPALITQLQFFLASIKMVTGELADAERLVEAAHEVYRVTRRWAADANRAGFLITAWADQDRLDDIRAVVPPLLASPYRPWYQEVYALVLIDHGALDEARDLISGLPPLEDSWLHAGVVAVAAHVRAALGDLDAVRTLRDELAPLAGRMANLGTGPSYGDIDLALAVAAEALGDLDGARRHLDASVELLERAQARPYLARALLMRARLAPDPVAAAQDRQRASDLLGRLGIGLPLRWRATS